MISQSQYHFSNTFTCKKKKRTRLLTLVFVHKYYFDFDNYLSMYFSIFSQLLTSKVYKVGTLLNFTDARLTLLYCAISGKSYSLLQCRCSCQFFVHSSIYCAVVESSRPLIGMPEPLPETGVLANHSSGKFERNERKNERMTHTRAF